MSLRRARVAKPHRPVKAKTPKSPAQPKKPARKTAAHPGGVHWTETKASRRVNLRSSR